MKSLFRGSSKQLVDMKTQEIQTKMNAQINRTQMNVQKDLLTFQQELGKDLSPELREKFNALVNKVSEG